MARQERDNDRELVGIDARFVNWEPERIIEEVASSVNHAMLQVYPFLSSRKDRFIEPANIVIVPKEQLGKIRREDKPMENNIFFQVLSGLGIKKEDLADNYYQSESSPSHINPHLESPILYLRREGMVDIYSDEMNIKLLSSHRLICELVEGNFAVLPQPVELDQKSLWRESARTKVDPLLKSIAEGLEHISSSDFEASRELIEEGLIDNPGLKFVAHGAQVNLVLDTDESLHTAQMRLGSTFNYATNQFISEPVVAKALTMLVEKRMMPTTCLDINSEYQRRRLQQNSFMERHRATLRRLKLITRAQVLREYLDSVIPLNYINSSPKKVDVWEYPS